MTRPKLLLVGRVTRPHGVRGEVKVLEGEGSSGAWRGAAEVFIGQTPEKAQRWRVRQVRGGGRFAILSLEGVGSIEQTQGLLNQKLFVAAEVLPPLPEGSYYAGELLGMQVLDRQGRVLGVLHEIFDNGAHEVYVVRGAGREVLLPVVDGVVLEVDPVQGRMVVDPPAGLPGLPGSGTE